ncbi:MAG: VanW family protein [Nocardioides sp.]
MTDEPYKYRTSDRRVIPWLLFGLVVLFGGLYVAGYLATSDRVPRGTTVSGVEIGGLKPASAEVKLAAEIDEQRKTPIVVTALDGRDRIVPARAGLDVDVRASVEQAGGGRSWAPDRIWASLTGGDDFPAVTAVDRSALREAVDAFAEQVDRPAREGAVRFEDSMAVPRLPRDGEVVDRAAAVDALAEAYLAGGGPVALPTTVQKPVITADEVSRAMDEFANPAVSGPVTIELADERIVLRPEDFVPALSMRAEDGRLVPHLNEKKLLAGIEPRMDTVALAPKDATVRIKGGVDGRPVVVPAKTGVTFDDREVTDAFLDVVVQHDQGRTLRVAAKKDEPEFTTEDAEALQIKEQVSEFTTYFPHADYRNVNLGRAAELVDGTVLKPGDVFSLNGIVGERTAENGFTKGFIISDGVYAEDFGGGVSQVATTTFNAMFFAGLKDIEHKPHSFYIDRYPVGREATVAWPTVDLKFKNDTPYGVLVQAWIDPSTPSSSGAMHVRMWSTKMWRITAGQSERYNITSEETRHLSGDDCYPHEGYGGFDIDVYRNFYKLGSKKLDHRETFHTTYTPSDTVVCDG